MTPKKIAQLADQLLTLRGTIKEAQAQEKVVRDALLETGLEAFKGSNAKLEVVRQVRSTLNQELFINGLMARGVDEDVIRQAFQGAQVESTITLVRVAK